MFPIGEIGALACPKPLDSSLSPKSPRLVICATSTSEKITSHEQAVRVLLAADPTTSWTCPFSCPPNHKNGFATRPSVPSKFSKKDFTPFLEAYINISKVIHMGFKSYVRALHSDPHPFSKGFVKDETTCCMTAMSQLDVLIARLGDFLNVVSMLAQSLEQGAQHIEEEIIEDLKMKIKKAVCWIDRANAGLVRCHVFYKVNYGLKKDVMGLAVKMANEGAVARNPERTRHDTNIAELKDAATHINVTQFSASDDEKGSVSNVESQLVQLKV